MLARGRLGDHRATDPLRLQGDESPVVAVNKPLLEATNAMWDASRTSSSATRQALPFHCGARSTAIQRAAGQSVVLAGGLRRPS